MIERLKLEAKNQRWLYFVPVAVVMVLIPWMCLSEYFSPANGELLARLSLIRNAQTYIPLFAIWWPIFVFKEYLNSPGNELMFAYRFGWDNLLMRMLALWGWYSLHWTVVCIGFGFILETLWQIWLMVLLQSFMMAALAYALAMLSKNTFLPLILSMLYALACLLFNLPFSVFNTSAKLDEVEQIFSEMLPALAALPVGVLLAGIGWVLEKRLWKKGQ